MATHRLPIQPARPKSGDVFFEPYSVKASNDQWVLRSDWVKDGAGDSDDG